MAGTRCRGYGGSACETLTALRDGAVDYTSSGTRGFPEGSFANGGAMRIAPVGLAYRSKLSCTSLNSACLADGQLMLIPRHHLLH